jgi:hypothetical protein
MEMPVVRNFFGIARMTGGIFGIAILAVTSTSASSQQDDAFHFNRLLGRGIDLGTGLMGHRKGPGVLRQRPAIFA